MKHFDHDNQAFRPGLVRYSEPAGRTRERTRFAQVLEDAADLLERHGELPDAVRWLRKEARAWRR